MQQSAERLRRNPAVRRVGRIAPLRASRFHLQPMDGVFDGSTHFRSYACYEWERRRPCDGEVHAPEDCTSVKNDPRLMVHASGPWPRAWLKWLDEEGWTGSVRTSLVCPQGAHYPQEVLASSLRRIEAESM